MSDFTPHSFASSRFSAFPGLPTPPALKPSSDGAEVTFRCTGGTDWWRCPFPDPAKNAASGPAWGFKRKIGNEGFEVRVELEVDHKLQLLFYLSPTEWVKAGAEYDNGTLWHGVVVCNPFSDWSIQKAIPSPAVFTISYDPRYTTLRVYLDDDVIREVKSFGLKAAGIDGNTADIGEGGIKGVKPADVLADKEVWIGVMACSPVGPKEEEKSALATFKHFETCEGTRSGE